MTSLLRLLAVTGVVFCTGGCASWFMPDGTAVVRVAPMPPDVRNYSLIGETTDGVEELLVVYEGGGRWLAGTVSGAELTTDGDEICDALMVWRPCIRYGVVTRGWFREWAVRWIARKDIHIARFKGHYALDLVEIDLSRADPPLDLSDEQLRPFGIGFGQRSVEWSGYSGDRPQDPHTWEMDVKNAMPDLENIRVLLDQGDVLGARKAVESVMWLADDLCSPAASGTRKQRLAIEEIYAAYREFEPAAKSGDLAAAARAVERMRQAIESLRPTEEERFLVEQFEKISEVLDGAEFATRRNQHEIVMDKADRAARLAAEWASNAAFTTPEQRATLAEVSKALAAFREHAESRRPDAAISAVEEALEGIRSLRPK